MSASRVTVVNFSHPVTPDQRSQIETLAGLEVGDVIDVDSRLDRASPIPSQVRRMVDEAGLTSEQWTSAPLIVILPALSSSAAVLLAELHGRLGYFPTIAVLRHSAGQVVSFEVAELIALQNVRDSSRSERRS